MNQIPNEESLLNNHILRENSVLFYKYPEGFKCILTFSISNNVKERGLLVYIQKGYVPKNMTLEDYRSLMKIYIPYRKRMRDSNNHRELLKNPEFRKLRYEKNKNYIMKNKDSHKTKQLYVRNRDNILRRNILDLIYQINNLSNLNLSSIKLLDYLRKKNNVKCLEECTDKCNDKCIHKCNHKCNQTCRYTPNYQCSHKCNDKCNHKCIQQINNSFDKLACNPLSELLKL